MTDATLQIDSGFPGGNIHLDRIEGNTVYLRPDLRDTRGHWFYWHFRIRGAAGRTLRFVFPGEEGLCIGARGPALSLNGGEQWQWLEESEIPETEAFSYNFGPDQDDVRFAFCLPYTLQNWQTFAKTLPPHLLQENLTLTSSGRPVPMVTSVGQNGLPLVILTARHHCCETSPNFVLEGLLQHWQPEQSFGLMVVPFVDLDGVEAGDQGKNRKPHDHNRDYQEFLYPETRAIRQCLENHSVPFVVLDLHCPYVREGDSETVYLVGSACDAMAAKQARFGEILETVAEGLPYHRANDVPFGSKWNVAANYRQGKSFAAWAEEQPGCRLSSTIEIPYANAEGVAVTPESCRRFGAALASAVGQFTCNP